MRWRGSRVTTQHSTRGKASASCVRVSVRQTHNVRQHVKNTQHHTSPPAPCAAEPSLPAPRSCCAAAAAQGRCQLHCSCAVGTATTSSLFRHPSGSHKLLPAGCLHAAHASTAAHGCLAPAQPPQPGMCASPAACLWPPKSSGLNTARPAAVAAAAMRSAACRSCRRPGVAALCWCTRNAAKRAAASTPPQSMAMPEASRQQHAM